jgi:beta-xylosidase
VVCEHIIRHYTEGWADGFEYDMEYWEIWNEPDLREEKPNDRPNWSGTRSQFFDLYEITAKHLKACFPHLKIGGPAVSSRMYWMDDFLYVMRQRNVPIDFISWHAYCKEPKRMVEKSAIVNELLHKYQYDKAERILNEWNYIRGWKDQDFIYSMKAIRGIKQASFIMAYMSAAQTSG